MKTTNRIMAPISAAFALLLGACSSAGVMDVGFGKNALHAAKCPEGVACESTLKVGAAVTGGVPSSIGDTERKGAPAKPVAWKNPDAGSANESVKLDPERNIYILKEPEPVAVPSTVAPKKKSKPKKDGPVAKPAEKKAVSSTGPPPIDVIPPPKPPINLVPKG